MKRRILTAVSVMALLCAVILCSVTAGAAGNSYSASFPVTVSNPKNNIPNDTKFRIVIEGQAHAPLPDPAEISADANGTYQFAAVRFTEPGSYRYTVRQVEADHENLITDTTRYEIVVTVIRDESGHLQGGFTISNGSGSGKPSSISFTNDYRGSDVVDPEDTSSEDTSTETDKKDEQDDKDKKDEKPPFTGEPLSAAFGGLILSGVLFTAFLVVWKKRTNTEVQPDE